MDNMEGYMMQGPPGMPKIGMLAFVDDTTWLAGSKQNMQDILDVVTFFFILSGVEINAKKTKVITHNSKRTGQETLMFGTPAEEIRPVEKNEEVRILGVWVNERGTSTPTQSLEREVDTICSILKPKAVTDRQVIYAINNVLIPKVVYRISAQIMSPTSVRRMTGKYLRLWKMKC
ncbi:hypothetical protein BGZ54_010444 [Gamsiella multidivaricata]|nr:hypothetical protein BGZ54_010444 [Gamsiella multidivaricata]